MAKTAYRRNRPFVEDMAVCTRHMHNGDEIGLSPRRRAIVRSLNRLATPRQREVLYLYYGVGLNLETIGKTLGLHLSSVSRTIRRGENHARQAMEMIDD